MLDQGDSKGTKDQLSYINHLYIFIPTTYISIEDIDLMWEDFIGLYMLIILL
jgi:hypothetical protein